MTEDQLIEMARHIYGGATPAEAVWKATGGTLEPGADSVDEPAEITVTVRLPARVAEFLRSINATPENLEPFFARALADLRRDGLTAMREGAAQLEPGSGLAVMTKDAFRRLT